MTALAYIDLSHLEPGNSSGQLDIKYSSARTYSGQILVRTTGAIEHDLLIPNVDSTTWRLTNIDAATVGRLLAGELVLSEPGHVNSVEVHNWIKIANTLSERLTQAEYTALATKDPNVLYLVIG